MMLSLFVPVYNEEKILEKSVSIILGQCENLKIPYEMIIVDDASSDNTPLIIQEIEKRYTHIRGIRFDNGPSRRENLSVAFKEAKGDIIAFIDVDLAPDISQLRTFIKKIQEGKDIVIGSRYKGISARREMSRQIVSRVYNWVISLLFSSCIRDHQCGFKVFRRKQLFDILERMGYDKEFRRGWFWDAEILIRAQRRRVTILEFPVFWVRGENTSFEWKREFRMIPYIIRLWWRL